LASSSTDEDRDARARRLFELGRTAYENARYEDAMRYFEESYALSGRAALLFNIGQAADRLRRDDRAIEAFEAYLAASPSAPNRVEVETRLEVLRRARAERNATDAAEAGATSGDVGSRESTEARGSNAEEAGAGVLGKWWFWAVVGAVVAGAAVGVAVAASAGGADPLPPGDFGGVILTLGEGR
jgi:tetratricopeptide (TPR) repeat protein